MPEATQQRETQKSNREGNQEQDEAITKQPKQQADDTGSLVGDMLKGALAGAVGVVVLDKVTWAMWSQQNRQALEQERKARPKGMDPAHIIANRVAEAFGTSLKSKQPHKTGVAVHYALGVGAGAVYGALRKRVPIIRMGAGTAFGLAVFLLQDEGLNPVIGTSGSPGEYPWQAHARGAIGHAVLGAVTEGVLNVFDHVLDSRP